MIHDSSKRTTVVGNSAGQKSADPLIEILAHAIGKDVLSAAEIMRRLGLSHRPKLRQNYLNPALSWGVVNDCSRQTYKQKSEVKTEKIALGAKPTKLLNRFPVRLSSRTRSSVVVERF